MANSIKITNHKPCSIHLRVDTDTFEHIKHAAASYGVKPTQYIRIILQADKVKWKGAK